MVEGLDFKSRWCEFFRYRLPLTLLAFLYLSLGEKMLYKCESTLRWGRKVKVVVDSFSFAFQVLWSSDEADMSTSCCALQSSLSWAVEHSKESLSCVISCMCAGFYCLFSACILTFLRTAILYLENTFSPLNDCVYCNSSCKTTQKHMSLCPPPSGPKPAL